MERARELLAKPRRLPWSVGCLLIATVAFGLLTPFGWGTPLWAWVAVILLLVSVEAIVRACGGLTVRNWAMAGTALLLLVVWVSLNPLSDWFDTAGWGREAFDQASWKASGRFAGSSWDNPRGRMLYSLLRRHRLKGLTEDEVIALLGPPNYVDRAPLLRPDSVPRGGRLWEYDLGAYSGMKMDADMLVLEFGGGLVLKRWVWQT
jgi:hypothetical protein